MSNSGNNNIIIQQSSSSSSQSSHDRLPLPGESHTEPRHESSMRLATDIPQEDRRTRRHNRRRKIKERRGAFEFLPVRCSNDLVHGSWWFVVGSVLAMLIPIVPLVNLFYTFWDSGEDSLPILSDAATFGLLIASGFFFTLGSLAFVRATEEPPLPPLFEKVSEHLATDELLAAWLFLLATIPFPIFMAVYVHYNVHILVYWGCLFASILFVIATYFFVLTCYPSVEINYQLAPKIAVALFGERGWINKHLSNDWLASTWLFFYATLIMTIGCAWMLIAAFYDNSNLEIFDWATSTIDAFIFLVGSAYFVAGSYPSPDTAASSLPGEEKPLLIGKVSSASSSSSSLYYAQSQFIDGGGSSISKQRSSQQGSSTKMTLEDVEAIPLTTDFDFSSTGVFEA